MLFQTKSELPFFRSKIFIPHCKNIFCTRSWLEYIEFPGNILTLPLEGPLKECYIIQRCVTIYTPKAKLKVVWLSQNIFNKKPIHVHFKLDFSVRFPFHLFLGRTCHKRINIDKLNKESKCTCEFHTHREVLGNLHKLQYICEKIRSDSHKLVWMKSFLVTL